MLPMRSSPLVYTESRQLRGWPTPIRTRYVYENEIRGAANVYKKALAGRAAAAIPYTIVLTPYHQ
ncbi:hypothetical protein [Paenibacillus oralis]|uniref:hypothetical protein n=1 Tax=Paenibacillus oralis TaxID=2490856 RepID=UPI000FFB9FE5|nr:hypothetical protein [Paenibacillus oralis]